MFKEKPASWTDRNEKKTILIVVVGIITILCVSMILIRANVGRLVPFVSLELENELGKSFFEQDLKPEILPLSAEDQAEWDKFTGLLTSQSDLAYHWKIFVCLDDDVNAFALPGGYICLNSGLIKEVHTSEELLGVLGHELGHVIKRHGVKALIAESMNGVLKSFFSAGLVGIFIETADSLNALSYSREQEIEADSLASHLLLKAQISPQGIISFFERKRPNAGASLQAIIPDWLSSHPPDHERLQAIKNRGNTDGRAYDQVKFPLDHFKALIAEHKPAKK
jgi:Zn-dependent protease with chaperone function